MGMVFNASTKHIKINTYSTIVYITKLNINNMTNETWIDRLEDKFYAMEAENSYLYNPYLYLPELKDFIQSEIDKALAEQKREIHHNMLETCRNWHGSVEAMVNDYFNNLK